MLRLGWNFIERRVPRDRRVGVKVHLAYAVYDPRTLQGTYWQHNPAFLFATFVDSLIAWYPYSGDRRAIAVVRAMLDHQLAYGTTPSGWAWPRVPFPTSCAGDRTYGRCFPDLPERAYGGVEPDKVGMVGLAYLRFHQLTGERRYLRAALATADALARHVRAGDASRTPWPFRVHGRTGAVIRGAQYGGAVVAPVMLLDELVRMRVSGAERYRRARELAWRWLLRHPLNRSSRAFNRWSGFYEDVRYNPRSRNQVPPTMTAYYLLTHPEPASIDPAWRTHVETMLEWVRRSFGRGPFRGAWAIDEQRAPGRPGCCSRAGLGSTTSRWGAMYALLHARTGDTVARERAVRALNYATYFARRDGRVSCCGLRRGNEYWFSDGYGDYLRSFNWAMAAMPELAPRGRNHLLGSTSVVQSVSYRRRSVAYRTFDAHGTEVLRLAFRPTSVVAGTRSLPLRDDLAGEGYNVAAVDGDFVVRIRRTAARRIVVSRMSAQRSLAARRLGRGWFTFRYRAHTGAIRVAHVLVPRWYRARGAPEIPLIISPHGRGVSGYANARRWGSLPTRGGFAVVNPDGTGNRVARHSWGAPGQIRDLARMPRLVARALPWLRINRWRVYAFGSSMGGQETLLLAARHPHLLAGAAAFDPVVDLARQYWNFPRVRCNWVCRRRFGRHIGYVLQELARREVGGTPRSAPRAYARRSPLALVDQIARGNVPIQLWWTRRDRTVIDPATQAGRFAVAMRRRNAIIDVRTGAWWHTRAFHAGSYALTLTLTSFGLLEER